MRGVVNPLASIAAEWTPDNNICGQLAKSVLKWILSEARLYVHHEDTDQLNIGLEWDESERIKLWSLCSILREMEKQQVYEMYDMPRNEGDFAEDVKRWRLVIQMLRSVADRMERRLE